MVANAGRLLPADHRHASQRRAGTARLDVRAAIWDGVCPNGADPVCATCRRALANGARADPTPNRQNRVFRRRRPSRCRSRPLALVCPSSHPRGRRQPASDRNARSSIHCSFPSGPRARVADTIYTTSDRRMLRRASAHRHPAIARNPDIGAAQRETVSNPQELPAVVTLPAKLGSLRNWSGAISPRLRSLVRRRPRSAARTNRCAANRRSSLVAVG